MPLNKLGFTKYQVIDSSTIHIFERLGDSGKIAMELSQNGIMIISISVASRAFEDYFLEMIGGQDLAFSVQYVHYRQYLIHHVIVLLPAHHYL